MAKLSRKQRVANKVAELKAEIAKLLGTRKSRVVAQDDPCAAEQAAYDAAVLVAAQKLIELEDAQAAYSTAFGAAMAAYIVLQQCRNQG